MHNKNPIIKSFTVINTLINSTNYSTEMTLVYKNISNDIKFDKSYTISGRINKKQKEEMQERLKGQIGLVE